MTTPTLEERKAQLAADQARIAAEEQAIADAAREAVRAKECEKWNAAVARETAKKATIIGEIEKAVRLASGWEADLEVTPNGTFIYKGNYRCAIDFTQKREGSSKWSSKDVPGCYYVFVGMYGERDKFPPKKDNTHSYDKIAASLIGRINDQIRKQQFEAKRNATINANVDFAAELRTDFGLHEYGSFTVKPSPSVEGFVTVEQASKLMLTPAQARELLELYRKFEVIKVK